MKYSKVIAILFLFFTACGMAYQGADVYIKTVSGHEYTCKNCSVYLSESLHWDEDRISVVEYIEGFYVNKEFEISKSKIAEIRIKLNR